MRNPFFSFLVLTFLSQILSTSLVLSQCLNDQRSLLLQLNNSLVYDSSFSTKLALWNQNVDCCTWDGVECDVSGHVIGLQLDNETITEGINSSSALFSFRYLENLSLAFNSFNSIAIPKEIRNLANLARLNLSNAGFGRQIPFELSEITNLVSLDLSSQFQGVSPLTLSNPNLKDFVQNLTRLEELYLDGVTISHQGDWWEPLSSSLHNLRNLSLRHCNLSGPLNPSFTSLQSLSVLRLDRNNLSSTEELDLFASFRNLTILTLSFCSLQGSFPHQIFQVPTLQYMDLSNNELLTGSIPEFPSSRSFITLMLRYTNFSGSLPSSMSNLSMLSIIDLSNCNFTGTIPSSLSNLSELARLDFSGNHFTGPVPVFSMAKKITYIDASNNGLNGSLSSAHFEGLSNLLYLNLGYNSLTGNIPSSLFGLPLQKILFSNNKFSGQATEFPVISFALDTLDLSSNQLSGPIPESFFNLQRLNVLLLSFNSYNGTLQLEKFQSLRNLTNLGLAYNNLSVTSTSDLSLFPQLSRLNLASCNLNKFPNLTNQSRLTSLDLSNNNISGNIPSWIWEIGNGSLALLNISCNFLVNMQSPYRIPSSLSVLDLHSNSLLGELPVLPPSSPIYLDYSSNNFQGPIPTNIGNFTAFASFLSVANNSLIGEIPNSLCNAIFLQVLDLSDNLLSGNIPNCLHSLTAIGVLNLGGNKISGNIPDTFSVNCGLKTLDLNSNNLQGKIPDSLANCTMLEVMNVGLNNITDRFPCILKNFSSLQVLVLRSNNFYGNISCKNVDGSWPNLQIIDLSSNKFSGSLYERCIESWNGMKIDNSPQGHLHYNFLELNRFYYQDTVTVTLKGLELELQKILTVFTSIDFSGNNFDGVIPDTVGELTSLYVLNLSRNSFTGTIPESIGNLSHLESLDLSWNRLTGEIPSVLTNLQFLSFFSVAYNNLLGRIPTRFQFLTFSPSSYEGNNNLCGLPLNSSCDTSEPTETAPGNLSKVDFDWQFIITGLGYGAGAALIIAPLALSKKWREKCDEQQDRLLKFIYPGYGFSYVRCDGKVEAAIKENIEVDTTDDDEDSDDDDDGLKKIGSSKGRYCVFCTKLDYEIKMAMHNPKCTCYYLPPTYSSYSPTSSSTASLLVMYQKQV